VPSPRPFLIAEASVTNLHVLTCDTTAYDPPTPVMVCDGWEIALMALAKQMERSANWALSGGGGSQEILAATLAAQIESFAKELLQIATVRDASRRELQVQLRAARDKRQALRPSNSVAQPLRCP
jgi:hypothetical protein